MALDFPTTLKLREEEHRAVMALVEREPLLSRAEAVTGAFVMGARIALQPEGFQELLGILRLRRQGTEVMVPRKPPESEKTAVVAQAAPRRNRRCA